MRRDAWWLAAILGQRDDAEGECQDDDEAILAAREDDTDGSARALLVAARAVNILS